MMAAGKIRSGAEIVKDFVEGLKTDSSLDAGVVGGLSQLLKEGKLTQPRLLQALEAKRKTGTAND